MTDKTLQQRLRDREGDNDDDLIDAAADALDAQEARIKALEGALRDWISLVSPESGWGKYTRMEGSELYTDAQCLSDNARALLGEK